MTSQPYVRSADGKVGQVDALQVPRFAGLATFARRGWRVAAFHVAPLLVTYLVWFTTIGSTGYRDQQASSAPGIVHFLRVEGSDTLHGIAQLPGATLLVVALLAVGLTLAWRHLPVDEARRRAAAPAACMIGSVVFLGIAFMHNCTWLL